MVAPHNLTLSSYLNALSFSLIRCVESPRLLFTVVCVVFFSLFLLLFYTGVSIDLSDLMVVHSRRQSLHLLWTAERKIHQIPLERLKKKRLILGYLFVR